MKLIGTEKDRLLLHFGRREKDLFLHILRLYPRVPPAHYRVSKSGPADASSQQLLEEALVEQRNENQKQLSALLGQPQRWAEQHSGWRLTLGPGEPEWLLQVLNDIRVGSWLLLGSPDDQVQVVDDGNLLHAWAMEVAGAFEISLLKVLEKRL